jgi:hypothetical protein
LRPRLSCTNDGCRSAHHVLALVLAAACGFRTRVRCMSPKPQFDAVKSNHRGARAALPAALRDGVRCADAEEPHVFNAACEAHGRRSRSTRTSAPRRAHTQACAHTEAGAAKPGKKAGPDRGGRRGVSGHAGRVPRPCALFVQLRRSRLRVAQGFVSLFCRRRDAAVVAAIKVCCAKAL